MSLLIFWQDHQAGGTTITLGQASIGVTATALDVVRERAVALDQASVGVSTAALAFVRARVVALGQAAVGVTARAFVVGGVIWRRVVGIGIGAGIRIGGRGP